MSTLPMFPKECVCPSLKLFRKCLVHPLTLTCCVCSTTSCCLCTHLPTPMCATHHPAFISFYILVRDITTAINGWICEQIVSFPVFSETHLIERCPQKLICQLVKKHCRFKQVVKFRISTVRYSYNIKVNQVNHTTVHVNQMYLT